LAAEKLGEHPRHVGALRQAVPVAAVGARDPIVLPQRRADADGDGLLPGIEVGEPRHLGAAVELVHLLLEEPDEDHPPVHLECQIRSHASTLVRTPDIDASTSKSAAKSRSPTPIAFAAVSSSLVTAVVGSGTSSSCPSSRARFKSFCIMWQSNHTSSGCPRTSGPRYATIG